MMRWFGPDFPPPFMHDDLDRAPTPVGETCAWCDEPVREDEYGFVIPHIDPGPGGALNVTDRAQHHECMARQMLGSVAHQLGLCTCLDPNSTNHDPPEGMTRRQAAKAALALASGRKYPT